MKTTQFRIALRHEGKFWNAYLAAPDSMKDARLIASILIGAAHNPEIKEAFIKLTGMMIAHAVKEIGGAVQGWEMQSAPEAERSGHG